MNKIERLLDRIPEFDHLEASKILQGDVVVGHHATLVDKHGVALGGGLGTTQELANRIALAEVIERKIVQSIPQALHSKFLLNEFPTTCGFAAGFEPEKTRWRAIAEGLERWAWSKWIDDGFSLKQILSPSLEPLAQTLLTEFDESRFYAKTFKVAWNHSNPIEFEMGVTLGITEKGIFPGSRVAFRGDDVWTHGAVEAVRHKRIASDLASKNASLLKIPSNLASKISYFAEHKEAALLQIQNAKRTSWPEPRLRILNEVSHDWPNVYLYRALFHDFVGWDQGNETRFVY